MNTNKQLEKNSTFTKFALHIVVWMNTFLSACSETNRVNISDSGSDYLTVWAGDKDGRMVKQALPWFMEHFSGINE